MTATSNFFTIRYDPARLLRRSGSKMWLMFFVCVLPILASAAPMADAITTGSEKAVMLTVAGILGGIVSLLVAIVKLMSAQQERIGKMIPRDVTNDDVKLQSKVADLDNRLTMSDDLSRQRMKKIEDHLGKQDSALEALKKSQSEQSEGIEKLLKLAEEKKA